ncbi:MAG: hypothetical protein QF893_07890 [Alphaproteobacteria bacterium]|jgi:hypothetical protein|nr:hypothetical protein [Alphaproteobacteria bacterium]
MTVWKTLLYRAARRLATDPEAQAKAGEMAHRAKPVLKKAMAEAKAIHNAPDPAREAGRLVGRMKRKYLDDDAS